MTRSLIGAVVVCALVHGTPETALAFGNAESFAAPAVTGGGGGRHFTGSMADGFTCGVCHTDGPRPIADFQGLPVDGYTPGTPYIIEVRLPDDGANASMSMELTNHMGEAVGTLELLPDPAPDERCGGLPDGELAAHRVDLEGPRQVIAMDACNAPRVRALFTAPPTPEGPIWFHASIVSADGSGDPTGDGAYEMARVIPVLGGSSELARIDSTCSATRGHGDGSAGWLLGLVVAGLWVRRGGGRSADG